ncbi:hypothetical protein KSS87_013137 [Heliosperma pusillum]|nr:hypothetical protein KSS87_013137 [Heliosperma pusillum]
MEDSIENARKIRKRGGCSPSSSTSSMIQNNRFKRVILGGKKKSSGRKVGTQSPSVIIRAAASPRYPASLSARSNGQTPVSARKLGATLWEMNQVPTPRILKDEDEDEDEDDEGLMVKRVGRREKMRRRGLNNCGYLPPHLSDPSHSPVSEHEFEVSYLYCSAVQSGNNHVSYALSFQRMEKSRTYSHKRRESTISRRLKTDHFDTITNASFMEIESRSQSQSPYGSRVGGNPCLKDVSNALTTSKELLKIISRMWGQEDRPSSRLSLVSALHSELERARLQINQLIQEEWSDNKEIKHLVKRFAEEKAAWINKEQELVEAALKSITGELEVERKLRRRAESLNKKLGKELAETKASFLKAVKELESEKKARVIVEQVYDELAANIGEEKTQMKILEAKDQFDEKTEVINLRNEVETFLINNGIKENGNNSMYHRRDGNLAFCESEARDNAGEYSGDSEFHSNDLNVNDLLKTSMTLNHSERKSIFNQVARRSTSLLRSVSNIVQWGHGSNHEIEKLVGRRSCGDEVQRDKLAKGVRNHTLPSSRFGLKREIGSPSNRQCAVWPSRELRSAALQPDERMIEGSGMRERQNEDRVEAQKLRKSRR